MQVTSHVPARIYIPAIDGPATTTTRPAVADSDLYVMKHPWLSAANFLSSLLATSLPLLRRSVAFACISKRLGKEICARRCHTCASVLCPCRVHAADALFKALGQTSTITYCAWRLPATTLLSIHIIGRRRRCVVALCLGGLPSDPNLRPAGSSHHHARPSSVTIHRLTGNQYHTCASSAPSRACSSCKKEFISIYVLPRARTVTDLRYGWPDPLMA